MISRRNVRRSVVGMKLAFLLGLLGVFGWAVADPRGLAVLAHKTLEGLGGGVLFGLVAAGEKIDRARGEVHLTVRRVALVVGHEVQVGLITGLLVGAACALAVLLGG